MGVNYGFDKLRFISPVKSGSRVRGRFTLAEAKLRKPKELQSRTNVTVEIEGEDKPALVADWLGLIYLSPGAGLDPAIHHCSKGQSWLDPLPLWERVLAKRAGEGSLSASSWKNPHPALRATFSHKGRRKKNRNYA